MQKKKHSLLEACVGTAIGFGVAFVSNVVIMHAMGFPLSWMQNFWMTVFFTIISVIRGYYVRRLFNWMHMKGLL